MGKHSKKPEQGRAQIFQIQGQTGYMGKPMELEPMSNETKEQYIKTDFPSRWRRHEGMTDEHALGTGRTSERAARWPLPEAERARGPDRHRQQAGMTCRPGSGRVRDERLK